jgi:hypothetical protein
VEEEHLIKERAKVERRKKTNGKGCSHNPTSQKGRWIAKKNNQNCRNIYLCFSI